MAKESSSRGKPEVQEVTFRPAKGGVVSETRMKYKRGGQGGGPMNDYESQTAVHSSHEEPSKHLKAMLGRCFGNEEKGEE